MINERKIKFFFIIICILQLLYILYARSGFQIEILKKPFAKETGIFYAISPEIIEINKIIKKHKLKDFELSKNLRKDTYLYQRSIEYNYPVRLNNDSKFIIFLNNESVIDTCTIIEEKKYFKLAEC